MITLWTRFETHDAEASRGLARILADVRTSTATETGHLGYELFASDDDSKVLFVLESWLAQADADRHMELLQENGLLDKATALLVHPQDTASIRKLRAFEPGIAT